MRRPLCYVCMAVTAIIYAFLRLFPPAETDYSALDRQETVIEGRVREREYQLQSTRSSYGNGGKAGGESIMEGGTQRDEDAPGSRMMILTVQTKGAVVQCRIPQADVVPSESAAAYAGSAVPGRPDQTANHPTPPIGSQVRICGKLHAYSHATNPGEFDQALYYQTLGIDYAIYDGVVEAVQGGGNRFSEGLCRVREWLGTVLDSCCNEEDASILKAMLLGEKGYLSGEIRSLYQNSGIIHILAISGLHISLIGMGLYHLIRKAHAPVPVSCIVPVAVMLLYGRMTGMSASSWRAVFMFLCHMAAILLLRTYDLLTSLCVAGVLLLVQQPLYLRNSGFLFSFGAVLSIGLLMPALPGKWMKSLAVPLATLPIYLQFYGTFPLYSLFLNMLVLPLMSAVMATGLALLVLGSLWTPLGSLCGIPAHLILTFYKAICLGTKQLPGSTIVAGESAWWQVMAYYAVLAVVVYGAGYLPNLCRGLLCGIALPILLLRASPGLQIDVIDVGQGDGIYISYETAGIDRSLTGDGIFSGLSPRRGGTRILIDGGSTSRSGLYQYQLLPFLESRGAGIIDLAIVTHGDEDHTSGLAALLEDTESPVRIRQILLPACNDPADAGSSLEHITSLAKEQRIPVGYMSEGDLITLRSGTFWDTFLQAPERTGQIRRSEAQFLCIHPESGASYGDANAYSVTLFLRYREFTAMLTGDLEGDGEERCLEYMKKRPDVFPKAADGDPGTAEQVTLLKVAHHGSSGATSAAFLKAVRPSCAVISCGKNNRYGHPHPETLERLDEAGAYILDTRREGAICFRTDGRRLLILGFAASGG